MLSIETVKPATERNQVTRANRHFPRGMNARRRVNVASPERSSHLIATSPF
jgi:hypothetical protein